MGLGSCTIGSGCLDNCFRPGLIFLRYGLMPLGRNTMCLGCFEMRLRCFEMRLGSRSKFLRRTT